MIRSRGVFPAELGHVPPSNKRTSGKTAVRLRGCALAISTPEVGLQKGSPKLDLYGQQMRSRRIANLQAELERLNDECARLEVEGPEHAWKKARSRRHMVANQLAGLQ